jgi:hypothetical protein
MLLLLLAVVEALAYPGILVGTPGADLHSDKSLLVVSQPPQGSVISVGIHVQSAGDTLGYVLPLSEALDPLDVDTVDPEYLHEFERYSAPRLQQIRCRDLAEVTYYPVGPGCGSFEIDTRDVLLTADADEALALEGAFAEADMTAAVVEDALLWIEAEGFVADPRTATALAEHAQTGAPFLVVHLALDPSPDTQAWLAPIQIPLSSWGAPLPLSLSAPTVGAHDLTVITLGPTPTQPATFERGDLEQDCMVQGDFASNYADRIDDALDVPHTVQAPLWVLEYSGPSDACEVCTRDPLQAVNLTDFGLPGINEAHITRWRHRYDVASPPHDLALVSTALPSTQAQYLRYDPHLEFAYPVCAQPPMSKPGVCPDLKPENRSGAGCKVSGHTGWVWLVLVPLLMGRRRRAMALVLLLALPLSHARATPPPLEILLDAPLFSTPRVIPRDQPSATLPRPLAPLYGGEGRIGLATLKRMNIGLTAGLHGFRGRGRDHDLRFSFVEPHLGVDSRHGRFREDAAVVPMFRVGLQASLGILDSAVYVPQTSLGARLHIGGGAILGTGPRRVMTELRASTVPRTDAYGVTFHPATTLTGWTYYPGTVNLSLLVGVAFE